MQKSAHEMTPQEIGDVLTAPDIVKMDIPDEVLRAIVDGEKDIVQAYLESRKI